MHELVHSYGDEELGGETWSEWRSKY